MATKDTEKKTPAKAPAKAKAPAAEKKPRAPRKAAEAKAEAPAAPSMKDAAAAISAGMKSGNDAEAVVAVKPTLAKDRYQFATGRRKTAIANVRIFSGKGDNTVNKKPFKSYFANPIYQEQAMKPLEVTGLAGDFYFVSSVHGGGMNAQSQAVRHGIAQALADLDNDVRKVLKKNQFLTRDDRKKERKKPGLRGARRSPQWAKR